MSITSSLVFVVTELYLVFLCKNWMAKMGVELATRNVLALIAVAFFL